MSGFLVGCVAWIGGFAGAAEPGQSGPKEAKSRDEIVAAAEHDHRFGGLAREPRVSTSEHSSPDGGRVFVAWHMPYSGEAACHVYVYRLDEAKGVWLRKSAEVIRDTHRLSVEFGDDVAIRDHQGAIVRRYAFEPKPKAVEAGEPAPAGRPPAAPVDVDLVKQRRPGGTDAFVVAELERKTFSPDKTIFAAWHHHGWDEIITLHDAATGKEFRRMVGHGDEVTRFVFSPDGRMLASFCPRKGWRLWDVATGKQVMELPNPTEAAPAKPATSGADAKSGANAKSAPGK